MIKVMVEQLEKEKKTVSKSLYNQITIGDSVHVQLKQGNYGIPWFIVRKE